MRTKLFEVRDRATFIPCFAILMQPGIQIDPKTYEAERFLLRRAGYDPNVYLVMFGRMDEPSDATYDPNNHAGIGRTIPIAHRFVQEHWDELQSGDVIDVEFVLHEVDSPKTSEREERYISPSTRGY